MSSPGEAKTPSNGPRLALLVVASLLLPVIAWLSSVGNVLDYLSPRVPPGQALYVFSKLAGLTSITLITLQAFLIVGRRFGWRIVGSVWTIRHHRILGISIAAVGLLHVALFAAAASARSGRWDWYLFVPKFFAGSYDLGVGLGVAAFWLVVVTVPIGALVLAQCWVRVLRPIHRLVALTLPLAIAHGLWIGSEKSLLVLIAAFGLVLVASVLVVRPGSRR